MEGSRFSSEELTVLHALFDASDTNRTGLIHINQFAGLLAKLGKNTDEILNITEIGSRVANERGGQLTFDDFFSILGQLDSSENVPFEGPDPKVVEFLRILEEYRVKCEEESNYLEAGKAHKQLTILRKQEEKRQQNAVKARQVSERQDVQVAHNMQFNEFNSAWDTYIEEYDNMAQSYIQQMSERHSIVLLEFQKQLKQELLSKPPKWSKELIEMRRKQFNYAKNKLYSEAQKLKKSSDKVEEIERKDLEVSHAINFAKKEAKYRLHQQAELHGLLKRIECRRKEHIKQRSLDSKRLLQRNRNVQGVLDSKQTVETQRIFSEIKKNLLNNVISAQKSTNIHNPFISKGNITSVASGRKRTIESESGDENNIVKEEERKSGKVLNSFENMTFLPKPYFFNGKGEFEIQENKFDSVNENYGKSEEGSRKVKDKDVTYMDSKGNSNSEGKCDNDDDDDDDKNVENKKDDNRDDHTVTDNYDDDNDFNNEEDDERNKNEEDEDKNKTEEDDERNKNEEDDDDCKNKNEENDERNKNEEDDKRNKNEEDDDDERNKNEEDDDDDKNEEEEQESNANEMNCDYSGTVHTELNENDGNIKNGIKNENEYFIEGNDEEITETENEIKNSDDSNDGDSDSNIISEKKENHENQNDSFLEEPGPIIPEQS